MQEWVAVGGTALGAVIALTSTILNDRIKWKREREKENATVRRGIYSKYIAALTKAHEDMRAVASSHGLTSQDRRNSIILVFHTNQLYRWRYEIGLVAGQQVIDVTESAFQQMRKIRDTLADGTSVSDQKYSEQRTKWGKILRSMQNAMRNELGAAAVTFKGGS
jgi:hypothetical protein